jgi:hypothetical protein
VQQGDSVFPDIPDPHRGLGLSKFVFSPQGLVEMTETKWKRQQQQPKENPERFDGAFDAWLCGVLDRGSLLMAGPGAVRNDVWIGREHVVSGCLERLQDFENSNSLARGGGVKSE